MARSQIKDGLLDQWRSPNQRKRHHEAHGAAAVRADGILAACESHRRNAGAYVDILETAHDIAVAVSGKSAGPREETTEPGAEFARFHLFIPVTGKLELTIGSSKPVEATPGQAYFMEKGTPHGFRNTGSSPAMVMEVFVKDGAATAQQEPGRPAGGEDIRGVMLRDTERT
jgi:mannose-6-phosphate isomerase-like protein (cupin superfamily)